MTNLWFDLTHDEEELDDENLYDEDEETNADFDEPIERLADEDTDDVLCRECGAVVEDGIQCPICGWLVGV